MTRRSDLVVAVGYTNAFAVKPKSELALKRYCRLWGLRLKRVGGRFKLYPGDNSGWPLELEKQQFDAATSSAKEFYSDHDWSVAEELSFDILRWVPSWLAPGEIFIIAQVSYCDDRDIWAYAEAVNADGEFVETNLHQINQMVAAIAKSDHWQPLK